MTSKSHLVSASSVLTPVAEEFRSLNLLEQNVESSRLYKGMSLFIYTAHTGTRLRYTIKESNLEQLQSWISQNTSIGAPHQILMTARGKPVRELLHETEIFLYDRRILSATPSSSTSSLIPRTPTPPVSTLPSPPHNSADSKSHDAWRTLFKNRRAWSLDVVVTAEKTVLRIGVLNGEAAVVQRSSAIAVENVKQHLGSLRPKYEEAKAWADDVRQDQQYLLKNWDRGLERLQYLPAIAELGGCLFGGPELGHESSENPAERTLTLKDFEDPKTTREAHALANVTAQRFTERLDDLENLFEDVAHDAFEIVDNFGQDTALSDSDVGDQAGRLMQEVEVVAKKMDGDYQHILALQETEKALKDMSRTALLHTRNFLPVLQQTMAEIDQVHIRVVERKNSVMDAALRYMQKVAIIESMISEVHKDLANLDIDDKDGQAFDKLNFIMKLPSIYGLLLVECVRRREWTEKITSDSSVLVEEVAIFKDEEAKRRKKWAKDMGGTVNMSSIDDMALDIDINLNTQKQKWPNVGRSDVEAYLAALRAAGGFEEAIKDIEVLTRALDTPTKQQSRRAKAFKNGSMDDGTPGKQSLLLHRDDDAVRSLESGKSKLEEKLKSSESRIRKLEDLLHRQSQTSRPPSSHAFGPNFGIGPDRQTPSPASNSLYQRIVALEGELATMREQLTSKAKSEDELKVQVQDAVSTKVDLLSNMEAQKQEFEAERRLVDEENDKLKIRLEEFEDEMDRMLESREHDPRVHQLEQELEKVRKDSAFEVQKAQGQVDFVKNDYTVQREKANSLERQIRELDEEVAQLSTRLQKRDASAATNHRALRTVMFRLSKDSVAPEDLDSLVETVEELAKQSQEHLAEVEQALKTVRMDNAALESRTRGQGEEVHELKEKVAAADTEVFSLRERIAKHKTEHAAVESELKTERNEHSQLRSRFAAGETDAESLRSLIAKKEEVIAHLNGKLTGSEATVKRLERVAAENESEKTTLKTALDNEGAEHQAKVSNMHEVQKAHDALASNLDIRAKRAEEVSARLYALKNSMGRSLEQVGYTVTKQDDTLTLQRLSKATTSSTVLSDPSSSMTRSVSSPVPSKSFFDTTTSSTLTNWPFSSPTSQSADFANFMSDIASLPPEAFSEAIIKRVKDADHTSRKYVKEARAYRDRYRRIQSETHDKITIRAFKEGDLVLFLPTRNQATGAWAAFNVGYPHYFLREQESHRLPGRDWLLARIWKIESRVVDLSKSMNGLRPQSSAIIPGDAASDGGVSFDDENPFELSDGLRWYLVDATEEKLGPPMTIGSSKSTVAAANVDAQGSMGNKKKSNVGEGEATVKLRGSLDSRRSSSNSKAGATTTIGSARPSTATSLEDRSTVGKGAGERVPEATEQQATLAADSTQPKHQSSLRHSSSQEPADPAKPAAVSPVKPQPSRLATASWKQALPIGSPSRPQSAPSSRKTSPEKPKSKVWDSLWSLDYSLESKGK